MTCRTCHGTREVSVEPDHFPIRCPDCAAADTGAPMTYVPALPPRCGSWIGTSPDGRVREFFARPSAVIAASLGWKIETARDYLSRINATARTGSR